MLELLTHVLFSRAPRLIPLMPIWLKTKSAGPCRLHEAAAGSLEFTVQLMWHTDNNAPETCTLAPHTLQASDKGAYSDSTLVGAGLPEAAAGSLCIMRLGLVDLAHLA